MAREAKAKEASCCEDRIMVTGAVIRHSTCKESKTDKSGEGENGGVQKKEERTRGRGGEGRDREREREQAGKSHP